MIYDEKNSVMHQVHGVAVNGWWGLESSGNVGSKQSRHSLKHIRMCMTQLVPICESAISAHGGERDSMHRLCWFDLDLISTHGRDLLNDVSSLATCEARWLNLHVQNVRLVV